MRRPTSRGGDDTETARRGRRGRHDGARRRVRRARGRSVRLEDENTYLEAAREASYPTHHLTRYLNTRYFEIDPRIRVRVREFSKLEQPETWTPSRQMAQGAQLRRVNGMQHFLDQYAEAKGSI